MQVTVIKKFSNQKENYSLTQKSFPVRLIY